MKFPLAFTKLRPPLRSGREPGGAEATLILRIVVALLFIGRSWQHLRWDPPYRSLLWSQSIMEGIVSGLFGMKWSDYVSSSAVDGSIQWFIRIVGLFYLICAYACFKVDAQGRLWRRVLMVGAASLFILAVLYFMSKSFQIGQLLEYTAQWSSPLLLLWLVKKPAVGRRFLLAMALAISLTFLGHGMYALGIHPLPGNFVDMVIISLGVSEPSARAMLFFAGLADLAIAACVFLPLVRIPILWYAVAWGLLTSLARIWANFYSSSAAASVDRWLCEAIYRAPHYGLPLLMLLLLTAHDSQDA